MHHRDPNGTETGSWDVMIVASIGRRSQLVSNVRVSGYRFMRGLGATR